MLGHSTEPRFRHVMMFGDWPRCRAGILGPGCRAPGHPMVAQVHDDQLGRQQFCRCSRPGITTDASALGAGSEVEHPLPGEVFDLAAAEYGISLGFSKSIGLPSASSGNSGPSPSGSRLNVTLMGARKMCRCLECKTRIRNASMTPMCSNSAVVSMISLAARGRIAPDCGPVAVGQGAVVDR